MSQSVNEGTTGPVLTAAQNETVQDFMRVTGQGRPESAAFMRLCNWDIQFALTKYFDEANGNINALIQRMEEREADHERPGIVPFGPGEEERFRYEPSLDVDALQELVQAHAILTEHIARVEPARRVVVPPPSPPVRPSFTVGLLLLPLDWGYKAFVWVYKVTHPFIVFLPGLSRLRAPNPRRQLAPRDAAARFRREFGEMTGSDVLPFAEMSYAQAFDRAKTEPKFLLVVLLPPEHDDCKSFARDVLLHPDVADFIADEDSNVLLWGGYVHDPEAFQIALEHRVTQYPFAALMCLTPKEGGGTRMGVVKRFNPEATGSQFMAQLLVATEKYGEDLEAARAVRVANEESRNIRVEQDQAYERSLAIDRQRAQERRIAERVARERKEAAERKVAQREQWRRWRALPQNQAAEPPADAKDVVRVAINLPHALGGKRLRRSFYATATVEDLYAFVECHSVEVGEDSADLEEPEGYEHEYRFQIASVLPREVHEPSKGRLLLDAIGRASNLIVEEVDAEDEE